MVPSPLNIVDMQGEKGHRFLPSNRVHLKSINVTIKQLTIGIQRIGDMDTFFFLFFFLQLF